ncbi:hypothetical protein [Nocardia sp. CC227C]|uniref:hypothetical protein n=1 Tax=Nocardia sp. CC227C TaxID=3044562 RepID=UPI00278C02CF|nr:hypothetical protein [Nocardia sp. CC227C]
MKYNEAALTELQESLVGLKDKLVGQASELQTAATNLMNAWEGNEGFVAFKQAKDAWDQEFGSADGAEPGSTIYILNKLSEAVGNALVNAKSADKAVYDGFSGA